MPRAKKILTEKDFKSDKNGIRRDVQKLSWLWTFVCKPQIAPHILRLKASNSIINVCHNITNVVVEFCRISAYLAGHAIVMLSVLNAIAWLVNFYLWFEFVWTK